MNVAFRIEGMTKTYGVSLLISDETFRNLEDPSRYHMRKIDQVKAKGKTEPVIVWEVFDADPPDILNYKLDIAMIFEDARSLYQNDSRKPTNCSWIVSPETQRIKPLHFTAIGASCT